MKLKQIALLLIVIALLPAIFYSAYEFTSLNENERLITEIYDQQLNILLNSVNQYAWDRTNSWVNQIGLYLARTGEDKNSTLRAFVEKNRAIDALFISDSLLQRVELISDIKPMESEAYSSAEIQNIIKSQSTTIQRLIHRKKVGYTKVEPLILPAREITTEKTLMLLFVNNQGSEWTVIGILLNSQRFIQDVLAPTFSQFPDQEVVLGIFNQTDEEADFTTGAITLASSRLTKKIWLFPDHVVGIKLLGIDPQQMARDRFRRSLLMILVLDSILIFGAVILYRNIKREMEFARLKSDFVANVSHELRTPLALIRMFSETLELNRVKSEEQRNKYYKIITQESERLTHLINNILDFSKMEAGKKQFWFIPADLNSTVKHILEFYGFHLENNDFSLSTEIAEKALPVNIDQEAVTEALINLLENAVKYSRERKSIIVRTGEHHNQAFVEVEDQGIGISENDQKRIFEKFYRVSGSLIHNTKGSGLGLALVDYTMRAHGGKVLVKSSPGKGSCFRLSFPLT